MVFPIFLLSETSCNFLKGSEYLVYAITECFLLFWRLFRAFILW